MDWITLDLTVTAATVTATVNGIERSIGDCADACEV
jgi:hypothetical protein